MSLLVRASFAKMAGNWPTHRAKAISEGTMPSLAELEAAVFQTARELYSRGPGYAQQSVVLREVGKQLRPKTLEEQQVILSAWHKLFQTGQLAWGYDLDNPGPPWYHIPASRN
jgi:hypothetical protein